MSRSLRINFNNAWYHVMNRGAAFKKIFFTNQDRRKFLTLLEEITAHHNIEIHAYCLMDNHYHLLVKTPRGNLSAAIRDLNSWYAKYLNRKLKIDGPLFKGRFCSTVAYDNESLLNISRYIHRNPVRAKMVKNAEGFRWSSYAAYLNSNQAHSWLFTNKILDCFSDETKSIQYKQFVESEDSDPIEEYYKDNRWVSMLGNDDSKKLIKKFNENKQKEIADKQPLIRPTIDDIKLTVAQYFQVKLSTIEKPKQLQENIPRKVAIWLSRKVGKYTLKEIARAFSNTSYSSISVVIWRIRKKAIENITIMEDICKIEKIL